MEIAKKAMWPQRYTIVLMCSLGVFICYLDRVNFSVAAVAMQRDFGWSETAKGWALASFFIGYLIFQLPCGWMANRYGGKILFACAVAWWSLITLLTPLAATISVPILILARILMGMGEAATFPAAYNLLATWVPASERNRSVAFVGGATLAGTLFAIMAATWIITRFNWQSVFYLFGILGFIWLIPWIRLIPNAQASPLDGTPAQPSKAKENAPREAIPWREIARSPAVWALATNHFAINWGFYVLLAWLPSYFSTQLGLNITSAGAYSTVPWIIMIAVCAMSSYAGDALSQRGIPLIWIRKIFQCLGLLGSAVFIVLAGQTSVPSTAVLFVSISLGLLALTFAGAVPNHLDIAPRHADVLASVTNTAGTLPGILGVVVTGWLVDMTASYEAAFSLTAGIQLIGAIIWLLFSKATPVIGVKRTEYAAAPGPVREVRPWFHEDEVKHRDHY